jgi:hypothetical protein
MESKTPSDPSVRLTVPSVVSRDLDRGIQGYRSRIHTNRCADNRSCSLHVRAMHTTDSDSRYHVAPHIKYCKTQEIVTILDIRTAQYLVLDRSASYLWLLLLAHHNDALRVKELVQRFGIDADRAAHDIHAFAKQCMTQGLLLGMASAMCSEPPILLRRAKSSLLSAWQCLRWSRRTLRREGFAVVYAAQRRWRVACNTISAQAPSLPSSLRCFQHAENFFSVRDADADCLPRSIALHRFLLCVGHEAQHRIGVRHSPFGAHAWVEVGSEVVYDSKVFVQQYTVIAQL